MLNYVIVVNDGGEMKTVTAAEIEAVVADTAETDGLYSRHLPTLLDAALNRVLDDRAIAAGEYDPSDNDTPFVVTCSALEDGQ